MKILFLTTHLNVGGITSYLWTLSRGLISSGHSVYIASSGGNRQDDFMSLGVRLYPVNIRTKSELDIRIYWATYRLRSFIREEGIQLVHAQTRVTQVMGDLLKRITGTAFCSTCHGFFKPRWSRKVFPCWGDSVVAISPAVEEHLRNDFRIEPSRIVLIRHGLDLASFSLKSPEEKQKMKARFHIQQGPVLGIIARLSDVKGHSVLLDAMPDVLSRFPGVRLVIVGEGPMEACLKEKVLSLGIKEHVIFFPVVNQTSDMLSLLDVFVLPSLQEGLGLSVMEAQAAGLPVVVSRVGGLPSLVQDRETGRLFEPRNSRQLAEVLLDVLTHPQEAAAMGRRARAFIEREFSAEKMVQETVLMCQRLIKSS